MKNLMIQNRAYRLQKVEEVKIDMFFEKHRVLIALLAVLFVSVAVLLHQTGIVVMK